MNEIRQKMERERTFFEQTLTEYDNAASTQEYVKRSINEAFDKLATEVKSKTTQLDDEIQKIYKDNLTLPGHIGKKANCKFINLKSFLSAQIEKNKHLEE